MRPWLLHQRAGLWSFGKLRLQLIREQAKPVDHSLRVSCSQDQSLRCARPLDRRQHQSHPHAVRVELRSMEAGRNEDAVHRDVRRRLQPLFGAGSRKRKQGGAPAISGGAPCRVTVFHAAACGLLNLLPPERCAPGGAFAHGLRACLLWTPMSACMQSRREKFVSHG